MPDTKTVNHPIQNERNGHTVFTYGTGRGDAVEWHPKGSSNGEDVQVISDELFQTPQFQKMLAKGVFSEVGNDDVVKTAQQRQRKAFDDREKASRRHDEALVDRSARDSISTMASCIAPPDGEKDNPQQCGTLVALSAEDIASGEPVLCDTHKNLRHLFRRSTEDTPGAPEWERGSGS